MCGEVGHNFKWFQRFDSLTIVFIDEGAVAMSSFATSQFHTDYTELEKRADIVLNLLIS